MSVTIVANRKEQEQTERPELIRIIRNNRWVYIHPSELTEGECRAIYVAAFGIYR